MNADDIRFSDDQLSLFLDGEAEEVLEAQISAALGHDVVLAARVEKLSSSTQVIRNALDLVTLNAPAMPANLATSAPSRLPQVLIPLGLAASFALGLLVSTALRQPVDWVDQVASYQALYVPETLSGSVQDAAVTLETLTSAQTALGLDLVGHTQIEGLNFKRVQMLGIEGAPLVQIAYVDAHGVPFALCAMPVSSEDRTFETEMNHALATVSWIENGIGFVLIGGTDQSFVTERAQEVGQAL